MFTARCAIFPIA